MTLTNPGTDLTRVWRSYLWGKVSGIFAFRTAVYGAS